MENLQKPALGVALFIRSISAHKEWLCEGSHDLEIQDPVIPAAYAFARYTFRGKRILFGLTLAPVMIPARLDKASELGIIARLMLPIARPAIAAPAMKGLYAAMPRFKVAIDQMAHAEKRPMNPGYTEGGSVITSALDAVWVAGQDMHAVFSDAQKRVGKLLRE